MARARNSQNLSNASLARCGRIRGSKYRPSHSTTFSEALNLGFARETFKQVMRIVREAIPLFMPIKFGQPISEVMTYEQYHAFVQHIHEILPNIFNTEKSLECLHDYCKERLMDLRRRKSRRLSQTTSPLEGSDFASTTEDFQYDPGEGSLSGYTQEENMTEDVNDDSERQESVELILIPGPFQKTCIPEVVERQHEQRSPSPEIIRVSRPCATQGLQRIEPDDAVVQFLASCRPPLLRLLDNMRRAGIHGQEHLDVMRSWDRARLSNFLRGAELDDGNGERIINDAFTEEVFLVALGV